MGISQINHAIDIDRKRQMCFSILGSTVARDEKGGCCVCQEQELLRTGSANLFEDHVTVVALVDGLGKDSHEGNHRQSSVVDFLVLVVNPSLIRVVNPVGSSQKISRDVSRAVLDLLGEPFNSTTSEDELEPSDSRELLGGLERVVGKGRVEGRVDSSGIEVPSEASGHGNTSVLELGFAVHVHCGIILTLGKTHRIEESHRGGDSDDSLVLPGGKRSLRCSRLLGRSKGGAVTKKKSNIDMRITF